MNHKKSFQLMIIGQIISLFGAALLRFGLSLYIQDLTGRMDLFAGIYAISSIPMIFSPIGGAIADRWNKRNLMVIFDFTSSVIVLTTSILLLTGKLNVPMIGVIMFLLAAISACYQPAVQASIPVLVEGSELEKANGIVSGVGALSAMVAPVLGGILYEVLGLELLIIMSGFAFFLSAVMELFIKIPFEKSESGSRMISTLTMDLHSGFHYILSQPIIRKSMILAALLNLILTPLFIVGTPMILRQTMKCSDTIYGAGMGVIQLSTILGALTVGIFAKRMKISRLYQWLGGITLLLIPIAVSVAPGMLQHGTGAALTIFFMSSVPIAMAMTIVSIFVITIVQKETPLKLLGKVLATITAAAQIAAPVGQFLYGVLFQNFKTQIYIPIVLITVLMLALTFLGKKLFVGVTTSESN